MRRSRNRQKRATRQFGFEQCETRCLLAAVLIDNFLAQPLMEEVAAGQEFSFYNVAGGDRGEVFNPGGGEVNWAPGKVEARVLQNGQFAGIFQSVNHVLREGLPLDFNALLPAEILPQFQRRATTLVINLEDGIGPFKVELKSPSNQLLLVGATTLTGGTRELRFALPNPAPANVQMINLITEGAAGNFFVANRIAIETVGSDLGEMEPLVWLYANLLSNWDRQTGRVRDRANFPSGDFDNVSATGGFAFATVHAADLSVITSDTAISIVEKVTEAVLNLPRFHGLLPHFVKGKTNPQIVADTEWSSLDTILTYIPILLARQALGLPTAQVEQAIASIDWDDLILENGTISHGYAYSGERLQASWGTFGGETFMAVLGQAASRPDDELATVVFVNPPTDTGSGFIDELAALYVPMPKTDVWGNNWPSYRAEAAKNQVNHYAQVPICCASAGEVPEPWKVSSDDIYQAFGIGGRIPDNDGTGLIGHLVATPHYPAMIASLQPAVAQATWDFLKNQGAISALNVVESVYVVNDNGVFRAVWNPLKGSWNLLLATLGYARALAGDVEYYEAARQNAFIAAGLKRLTADTHIAVFRNGMWFLDFDGQGGMAEAAIAFGLPGDKPFAGDFDGNGKVDLGLFRNGMWFFDLDGQGRAAERAFAFGLPSDVPVAGDWNGDGRTDVAVFRNGMWFFDLDNNGRQAEKAFAFGIPGDVPRAGDFNGDGKADAAIFRGGRWFFDLNNAGGVAESQFSFGIPGDVPVVGDWDADGRDNVAVFRRGRWFFDLAGNGGAAERSFSFGIATDLPVAGAWRGTTTSSGSSAVTLLVASGSASSPTFGSSSADSAAGRDLVAVAIEDLTRHSSSPSTRSASRMRSQDELTLDLLVDDNTLKDHDRGELLTELMDELLPVSYLAPVL